MLARLGEIVKNNNCTIQTRNARVNNNINKVLFVCIWVRVITLNCDVTLKSLKSCELRSYVVSLKRESVRKIPCTLDTVRQVYV